MITSINTNTDKPVNEDLLWALVVCERLSIVELIDLRRFIKASKTKILCKLEWMQASSLVCQRKMIVAHNRSKLSMEYRVVTNEQLLKLYNKKTSPQLFTRALKGSLSKQEISVAQNVLKARVPAVQ